MKQLLSVLSITLLLTPPVMAAPTAMTLDPSQRSELVRDNDGQSAEPQSEQASPRWSLPMNGQLKHRSPASENAPPSPESSASKAEVIQAGVTVWDTTSVNKIVDNLVDYNVQNNAEARRLDALVKKYRGVTQKTIAMTKDSLNYSLGYQGCGPSARAGKIILDDKIKIKDRETAEYHRQRYVDKVHSKAIMGMMQIAEGLGVQNPQKRQQLMSTGTKSLEELVGSEKANATVATLSSWLTKAKVPSQVFSQPAWSTMERQAKLETILKASLEQDPLMAQIKKRVEKYAHPTKLKQASTSAVETAFNLASWAAPGWAIPIAIEAALDGFIQATGGSETKKLEKELLLDKRIQSRLTVLNEEASVALDNYRYALVTHNSSLLTFSQSVLGDMSNKDTVGSVLVGQVADPKNTVH